MLKLMTKQLRKSLFKSKADVSVIKRSISNQSKLLGAASSRYNYKSSSSFNPKYVFGNYNLVVAASVLAAVGGYELLKNKLGILSECCGIIGYVGQDPIAEKLILDGLQILQYRGYDS